jgi:hypothetical protein
MTVYERVLEELRNNNPELCSKLTIKDLDDLFIIFNKVLAR